MDQLPAPRPSIGLALGGGVARGWAHIGVLRTLIKAGLEPDILAGSSSGGVVAAAYATGHLDDLEAWTRSLSPRRIRGLVDLVWNGQAVIGGERLAETLTAYMGTATFETTARPLTLIGTELSTGHEVWLQRGPIVPAVQASYALPGVFAPVTIDGRALIDGAIVNPCPISAVRAMGARIVIAVTLHASEAEQPMAIPSFAPAADEQRERMRLAMPESFSPKRFLLRQFFGDHGTPGLMTVMAQALNILMDRMTKARLAADPPDVLIIPPCGAISLVDFHRADEAIRIGEDAAMAALPAIRSALRRLQM